MRTLLAFWAVALMAAPAPAQEVEPRCDRPLIVREGQGVVGLDLALDLSHGRAGRRIEVGSFHPADHRDGLSLAVGVSKGFEFGAALQLVWHQSRTTPYNYGNGTEFGGFYAYGVWAFLPYLGVEVGLQAPSKAGWERLRVRRVTLQYAMPFQTTLIPGRLAVRLRPDLLVGFAQKYYDGDQGPPQYSVFAEAGLTFNWTREFFVDLSVGAGKVLKGRDLDVQGLIAPGRSVFVPLSLQVGYSVTDALDLSLAWTFPDVRGLRGDGRFLTFSAEYRY